MRQQWKQWLHGRSATSSNGTAVGDGKTADSSHVLAADDGTALGMKELVSQPSHSGDAVDIVAVHGLNGHQVKTWTDKSTRICWLSHDGFLPTDIPNARVLAFGYNSASYFSRSSSTVADFATELLASLKSIRRRDVEQHRPIVFLCHSLGGLVFKQAVVRAHEQADIYSSILDSTKAVMFFATPHRGSELASWDHLGTMMTRAATFGLSTNANLSKDLKVNSDMTKRMSDSFARRAWGFQIRSFYETELMPGLNRLVVERESAVLKWGNEIDIPLPAHHGNICKFSSAADHRYRLVASTLQDIIKEFHRNLVQSPLTGKETSFLEALSSDYERQLRQVDDRVPGTCEWVLSHPTYQQWQSSKSSCLLWITSNAGCGKSILAKFLVQHFKAKKSTPVCYFFFLDGIMEQNNAASALAALLHQACRSDRAILSYAVRQREGFSEKAPKDQNALWSTLCDSLALSELDEVVWVLDGLDECEAESLRWLMQRMSQLFDSLSSRTRGRLKVILLSRPSSLVQNALGLLARKSHENPPHSNRFRLEVENESKSLMADILRFALWKTEELASLSALPEQVQKYMQERLVAGADFTFLWISLVLKAIEDATLYGVSVDQVVDIFNTTSLDDIYLHLLRRVCQNDPWKTRKLLSLILAAVRPLTVEEMCVAVEIQDRDQFEPTAVSATQTGPRTGPKGWLVEGQSSPKTTRQSFEKLEQQLRRPFDNHVRQLCGHFVRIRDGRLYLVHQTAKAFLARTSFEIEEGHEVRRLASQQIDPWTQWPAIAQGDAEILALRVCVNYIKIVSEAMNHHKHARKDNQKEMETPKYGLEVASGMAFLPYASLHWVKHYRSLRRNLDGVYDGLLQPGTKLFRTWSMQKRSQPDSTATKPKESLSRSSCDSQSSMDWEESSSLDEEDISEILHDDQERFSRLRLWIKVGKDLNKLVPENTATKIAVVDMLLYEEDEKEKDRLIALSHKTAPRMPDPLAELQKKERSQLLREFLEKLGQSLDGSTSYLVSRLLDSAEADRDDILATEPGWDQATRRRVAAMDSNKSLRNHPERAWEEAKQKERLLDMLLHFGLFRPEEAGLEHDMFLDEHWGKDYEKLPIHGAPQWVKKYIGEKARTALKMQGVVGTPGASLPGLSNPTAGTGGAYLHARFGNRKSAT